MTKAKWRKLANYTLRVLEFNPDQAYSEDVAEVPESGPSEVRAVSVCLNDGEWPLDTI